MNERLFDPQRSLPVNLIIPPWPEPYVDEPFPDYVRRIVSSLPPLPKDYWLGGVSFGGNVALQAAKLLHPRGVFVIASHLHWRELSFTTRLLAKLTPFLPNWLIVLLLKLAPLLMRVTGRPNRQQRELLMDLLRHPNLPLTRWGPAHISNFEFSNDLPCPIYRIHGTNDRVISFPKNSKVDLAVDGAGHVVNVTHSEQVNAFIADHIGSSFTV